MEVNNYQSADALWTETRRRKLANNTYLEKRGDAYAVRLHATDVVTWHPDGRIVLDSGGWKTVTTKARINEAIGSRYDAASWSVWSEKGIWYIGTGNYSAGTNKSWAYADGITLHPDETVTGEGDDPKAALKLRRQLARFARDYIDAFMAGEVEAPGGGDCWGCLMVPQGGGKSPMGGVDHIVSHMEEGYFVPSMLTRAIERFPVSQFARQCIAAHWDPAATDRDRELFGSGGPYRLRANGAKGNTPRGIAETQLEKSLKRWLYEETGSAA